MSLPFIGRSISCKIDDEWGIAIFDILNVFISGILIFKHTPFSFSPSLYLLAKNVLCFTGIFMEVNIVILVVEQWTMPIEKTCCYLSF